MMAVIEDLARKSAAKREPGDYVQDGLLYCGHCRTPKQCRIDVAGHLMIVGCQCACATRRFEAERKAQKEAEQRARIESLRDCGILDKSLTDCKFSAAKCTPELQKCKRYADAWAYMSAGNNGLLLWGGTGNGKTYAAACVANELIDRGIPAMITSLPRILNAGLDKQTIIEQMHKYPLVVLDDLSAERNSDYAREIVYLVIDERYKAKKPLIVTTNLALADICKPETVDQQRIYDRILEMCVPVAFCGESLRRAAANEKKRKLMEILNGKED